MNKAGAILTYLAMGLNFIVSMVYTPFMLRTLGQSEYGLYNLVASIVSYLGLLSFGFGSAYVRFYSRYKVKEDRDNIAKLNGMYLCSHHEFRNLGYFVQAWGVMA